MNETDNFPYIAFLTLSGSATPERLEYSFHTFSLRNECCYAPTNDVTFTSPNPDANILEGGVERLVNAVLQLEVTAVVMSAESLKALLDDHATEETIEIGKGMTRTRQDALALYEQSLTQHFHDR